jgi:hypothetical protein
MVRRRYRSVRTVDMTEAGGVPEARCFRPPLSSSFAVPVLVSLVAAAFKSAEPKAAAAPRVPNINCQPSLALPPPIRSRVSNQAVQARNEDAVPSLPPVTAVPMEDGGRAGDDRDITLTRPGHTAAKQKSTATTLRVSILGKEGRLASRFEAARHRDPMDRRRRDRRLTVPGRPGTRSITGPQNSLPRTIPRVPERRREPFSDGVKGR